MGSGGLAPFCLAKFATPWEASEGKGRLCLNWLSNSRSDRKR